jgi:hypothetical protein
MKFLSLLDFGFSKTKIFPFAPPLLLAKKQSNVNLMEQIK